MRTTRKIGALWTLAAAALASLATTYFVVVAPPIAAQSAPLGRPPPLGQRTHWYA